MPPTDDLGGINLSEISNSFIIQSGAFAQRFIDDQDNGGKEFLELREKEAAHSIEQTGKSLRSHFAWKQEDADYTEGTAAR